MLRHNHISDYIICLSAEIERNNAKDWKFPELAMRLDPKAHFGTDGFRCPETQCASKTPYKLARDLRYEFISSFYHRHLQDLLCCFLSPKIILVNQQLLICPLFSHHFKNHFKPVLCPVNNCATQYRSAEQREMRRHVQEIHAPDTVMRHHCPYCPRNFARRDSVRRHLKLLHSGVSPDN